MSKLITNLDNLLEICRNDEARDAAVIMAVENGLTSEPRHLESAVGAYRRKGAIHKSVDFARETFGYKVALKSCIDAADYRNAMYLARESGDLFMASHYAQLAGLLGKAAKYAFNSGNIVRAFELYGEMIDSELAVARRELEKETDDSFYLAGNHFFQAGLAADARNEIVRANDFFEKAKQTYLFNGSTEGLNASFDVETHLENPARKKHYEFPSSEVVLVDERSSQ